MPKSLSIIALVFAAIVAPTVLKADSITYAVNQTVGIGSVVGSITTNGTIGTLTRSEITGWALTLNDGTNSLAVSSASPTAITQAPFPPSTDLTATLTNLLFNFSSTDSGFLILGLPTVPGGGGEVTWEASGSINSHIHIFDIDGDGIFLTTPTLVGNQVIASVSAAVPEPSTISLMLIGIGLVFLSLVV
jgi:hypothetical protein